ncbi:nucleotidyl transferase AbiEii/AbiGii toxin family protein [Patescibacteria group bacterium]|nr:nucleotidyl transferase AbiEii/AbiGii toxin family protein [Patescibacteria group bacterium]
MFDKNRHKIIMIKILKEIYADMDLGKLLGFKGGTMAFLFYDLPRMSVDLDFDLLKKTDENFVLERLEKILLKFGKVTEKIIKKHTLLLVLDYGFGERKLKIEVSRKKTNTKFVVMDYLGIAILVMNRDGMVAGKLLALVDRKKFANRDVFDTWFFLKNDWGIDERVFLDKVGLSKEEVLKKAMERVEKIKDNEILFGLGDLLDNKQKEWAKRNLKKETLFNLRLRLE